MANLNIYIENITPTDIIISDLGLVFVSGAFIDLNQYFDFDEIAKSSDIIPYVEDGSILVYDNENKTDGALSVESAKKHLSLQTEYIDSLDETALSDRITDVELQIQSILNESGLEVVLSVITDGTSSTYNLDRTCGKILVIIDGIIEYDYIQPDGTDILTLGFVPIEDCLLRAFSFSPTVDGTATTGGTNGDSASMLVDLTDVEITQEPENGQVLTYDNVLKK